MVLNDVGVVEEIEELDFAHHPHQLRFRDVVDRHLFDHQFDHHSDVLRRNVAVHLRERQRVADGKDIRSPHILDHITGCCQQYVGMPMALRNTQHLCCGRTLSLILLIVFQGFWF